MNINNSNPIIENFISSFNLSADNHSLTIDVGKDENKILIDRFQRNRNIEDPAFTILTSMYSVLILLGALGNCLVVAAVLRKPVMRTARNTFIVNLAVSDLLLCLVTMPLTLVEILTKYWPFGKYVILCKMIGTLQATSIFVSTISITSIALDRYQVIVYPTRDNLHNMGSAIVLIGIWLFAILLASPMFLFKRLIHYDINLLDYGISTVGYCIEEWPVEHGRVYYSAFSLCVQYLLPILIVSAAYSQIYGKLKNRFNIGVVARDNLMDRKQKRNRRMRRTNCLLINIAVIFGVSWLPLNLFNLFSDIYLSHHPLTQEILVIYAVCHMIGMSSACSNPLLYGWLNENFKKEFKEILCRQISYQINSSGRISGVVQGQVQELAQQKHDHSGNEKRNNCLQENLTENLQSTEMTTLVR